MPKKTWSHCSITTVKSMAVPSSCGNEWLPSSWRDPQPDEPGDDGDEDRQKRRHLGQSRRALAAHEAPIEGEASDDDEGDRDHEDAQPAEQDRHRSARQAD